MNVAVPPSVLDTNTIIQQGFLELNGVGPFHEVRAQFVTVSLVTSVTFTACYFFTLQQKKGPKSYNSAKIKYTSARTLGDSTRDTDITRLPRLLDTYIVIGLT